MYMCNECWNLEVAFETFPVYFFTSSDFGSINFLGYVLNPSPNVNIGNYSLLLLNIFGEQFVI